MIILGKQPIKYYLTKTFKDDLKSREVNWGYGGLSEFTYYRTYAREMENGQLETWADCVIRVIEGMFSILKTHSIVSGQSWAEKRAHKLAEEAAIRLFEFKWTPPGRGLWMMGTPFIFEKSGAALNNCAFVSTENIDYEMSKPFAFLMDMSMLGVGVGFDTKGAGKVYLREPKGDPEVITVEDSREGWVELLSCLIDSYMDDDHNSPIEFDTSLVRAEGELIKGFGGLSSGPGPLEQGFNGIKDILSKRANSEDPVMTSSDIVDIMNIIGKVVVAGNVRRTAEIAFSNPDDQEFLKLKDWELHGVETGAVAPDELKEISMEEYELYNADVNARTKIADKYKDEIWAYKFGGWRWASNNSIFAEVGMDYTEIAKQIATNGEPGLAWLENMQKYSRMKDEPDFKDHRAKGGNPCVSGDTLIATDQGLVKAVDLVGKHFKAVVDGKLYNSTKQGFWSSGIKPTYRLTLDNGMWIEATGNHKFLTKEGNWEELQDLSVGDSLKIANNRNWMIDDDSEAEDDGYVMGQLIGDGTFDGDKPRLSLWVDKKYKRLEDYKPYSFLLSYLLSLPSRSDFMGFHFEKESDTYTKVTGGPISLREISNKYGVYRLEKRVPETESMSFNRGLLRGLFDSDGSIQGTQAKGVSIRLSQTDMERLEAAQRLLATFGISSKIFQNRQKAGMRKMPDGKGGLKEYMCKATHELIISRDSIPIFYEEVGFLDNDKQERLENLINSYKRKPYSSRYDFAIVSIESVGEQEVFDCTIEEVHRFSGNGIIAHNCLEQTLEPYELCCLVETYPAKHEDYWDFQRSLKFAYLYAKAVTLVPTHWTETNDIIKRNRRIGTSQSGIQEAIQKFGRRKYLDTFCDQAYDYVRYVDKKYSEWLGVPISIKSTSTKPSGTVSLVAGALPGIHYAESDAYYRLVRIAANSPLVVMMENANYRVEPAISDPIRTRVVYFPILLPENTISKNDVSIWEQFANAADIQHYWADNQVSITITFQENEKDQIARALSCFDSKLKGVSLLPASNHGFAQAPYTPASREEIQDYMNTLLPLDFSVLDSEGDDADSNKFCDTTGCEI